MRLLSGLVLAAALTLGTLTGAHAAPPTIDARYRPAAADRAAKWVLDLRPIAHHSHRTLLWVATRPSKADMIAHYPGTRFTHAVRPARVRRPVTGRCDVVHVVWSRRGGGRVGVLDQSFTVCR